MDSSKGFTLVELLIVIVIVGIIASIAAPSYQEMMGNNRLTSASNTLVGALQLARSEAVTYSENVTLCSSDDQVNCGGSWADGAIVLRAGGEVVRILPPFPADIAVAGSAVQYDSNGRLGASASLSVNNSYGSRAVQINRVGRASICKENC